MSHQITPDTPQGKYDLATLIAAIRKDAVTPLATSDGNYALLTVDNNGCLRVQAADGQLYNTNPVVLVMDKAAKERDMEIITLLQQIRDALWEMK